MSAVPASKLPRLHREEPVHRRRAIWRQRLIDAEGGLRLALRANSTLYVHLFAASLALVSGMVLGLTFVQWLFILVAVVATMAAELANLSLQMFAHSVHPGGVGTFRQSLRLATAATMVVLLGSLATVGGILGRRIWELFQ